MVNSQLLESEVKSCSCNPMDYTDHEILQVRILEWVTLGNLSLLHGIFANRGSNPGLPHCRQILYQLNHKGSPRILEWVTYPFSIGSSPTQPCPKSISILRDPSFNPLCLSAYYITSPSQPNSLKKLFALWVFLLTSHYHLDLLLGDLSPKHNSRTVLTKVASNLVRSSTCGFNTMDHSLCWKLTIDVPLDTYSQHSICLSGLSCSLCKLFLFPSLSCWSFSALQPSPQFLHMGCQSALL